MPFKRTHMTISKMINMFLICQCYGLDLDMQLNYLTAAKE